MMLAHFAPVNWAETITATSSKATKRMQFYVVQDGDTLAGIALRYVRPVMVHCVAFV